MGNRCSQRQMVWLSVPRAIMTVYLYSFIPDRLQLPMPRPPRMHPQKLPIPMFSSSVACGFPSPAEESIEQMTSLDDIAIHAPAATFLVRASSDSMIGAGIYPGDILVVDRSRTPRNNDIVIAVINGEFTCKRLHIQQQSISLLPENPKHSAISISTDDDFIVWGVCTFNLHRLSL